MGYHCYPAIHYHSYSYQSRYHGYPLIGGYYWDRHHNYRACISYIQLMVVYYLMVYGNYHTSSYYHSSLLILAPQKHPRRLNPYLNRTL